jgi:hypothetical protein
VQGEQGFQGILVNQQKIEEWTLALCPIRIFPGEFRCPENLAHLAHALQRKDFQRKTLHTPCTDLAQRRIVDASQKRHFPAPGRSWAHDLAGVYAPSFAFGPVPGSGKGQV